MAVTHRSELSTPTSRAATPPLLDRAGGTLGAAVPAVVPAVALAVVAGTVLGVTDLYLQLHLPYPWADLANASAVWATAAFVVALAVTSRPATGAVVGAVMLVVAVEAYYGAAVVGDRAATATMWSPTTVVWLESGVLAGVVFGLAGAWTRGGRTGPAVLGCGVTCAVLLGEAAYWLANPDLGRTTPVALAALGVLVVAAVGVVTRRPGVALGAYAAALPMAPVFAAAFAWGLGR